MRWIDSISELEYYTSPSYIPCYCESLTRPEDMILQGILPGGLSFGGFVMTVQILSADGLTVLNPNINSSVDAYYAINPDTNFYFFNLQLFQFPQEMCDHKCFILRVTVTQNNVVLFDKYTERYCQFTCCETASGVQFNSVEAIGAPAPASPNPLIGECGTRLIRIISRFPCNDNFTGEYYGQVTAAQGSASFGLVKITTIQGRVRRMPRDITREYSYNCRPQRAEAKATYMLESLELLPEWKMIEIENQLAAPELWIDDFPAMKQYNFSGGTPFTKPDGLRDCDQYFKLQAGIEDCTIRQVYGCDPACPTTPGALGFNLFFVLPDNYVDGNYIYNDTRQPVATTADELVDYFNTLPGVDNAELVAASPVDCDYHAIIGISGTGVLPNIIYYNNLSPANRIDAVSVDEISDICDFVPNTMCPTPILGVPQVLPLSCPDAQLGTPTVTAITPFIVPITGVGNWQIESFSAELYNNQVLFSVTVRNYTIFAMDVMLAGEPIANMGAEGRPSAMVSLSTANNSTLTPDQYVTVDQYGVIAYGGEPTGGDDSTYVEIQLNNLIYNI